MIRFRNYNIVLFTSLWLAGASFSNAADLNIGQQAPDFSATGIDGKPWKLSSLRGKQGKNVVLLFTRASW